jgi:hypothetical protein
MGVESKGDTEGFQPRYDLFGVSPVPSGTIEEAGLEMEKDEILEQRDGGLQVCFMFPPQVCQR